MVKYRSNFIIIIELYKRRRELINYVTILITIIEKDIFSQSITMEKKGSYKKYCMTSRYCTFTRRND